MDYEWTDIPYASAVNFELHYDSDCISQADNRTEYCFTVEVTHDGKPLKFDTCLDNNTNRGSKSQTCTYPDFKQYISKIKPKEDVFKLCDKEY